MQNNSKTTSLSFWLHVTDNCNLTCDYCYISTLKTKKNMKKIVFRQLAIKLKEAKTIYPKLKKITIKIAGGEPLTVFNIWKDPIERLISEMNNVNIHLNIRILTNLTILSKEIITFCMTHNVVVSVSIDGLEEYHNKYRKFKNNCGSFALVNSHILQLREHNIHFNVLVTISSENIYGVVDLVKFLLTNNIPFRLADAKGTSINKLLLQEVLDECYRQIDNYIEKGFSPKYQHVLCDLNLLKPSSTPCTMGISSCAIYIDGSLYFCHSQFGKTDPVGTLFDHDDIVAVLQRGNKYHSLADECKTCEYLMICAGGCPLYRTEENKSPMCDIFKSTIPKIQNMINKEAQMKEKV